MKYVTTTNLIGDKIVLPYSDEMVPYCPICGACLNGCQAYTQGGYPSEEICPDCGVQFGDDDLPSQTFHGNTEDHFNQLRLEWLSREGWTDEQVKQLKNVLCIDAAQLRRLLD